MTRTINHARLLFWSFTVALGGFLFGFDTAVISGAEQAIQAQWALSDALIGLMVSSALAGTVIGAIFGGIPCDRYGRKITLFWIGVLYLVSALGSALAPDAYSLMLFRFLGGLGVGASSVAAPVYISEIAPTGLRGRLTAMFQFNLVFGILCAYLSNYGVASAGGDWRIMLGVEVVPALLFVILILFVPRSPRWLITRRAAHDEARRVLTMIDPSRVEQALAEIEHSHKQKAQGSELREFLSGRYRWPILLAFLFAFFNQVSGINAVIYYAPRIFSMAGMESSAALLSSAGLGLVNLVFTLIGLALIDRFGRRFLMYIGSFGYILSLTSLALIFHLEAFGGSLVPLLIFVFIASHAIGQGACIWVFIAEIFPNSVRGYGMSLGSGTHWVFAALVAFSFPYFAGTLGGAPLFAFFAVMMVLQLLFVRYLMPETKGVSLEDLEVQLSQKR
ncbi:MULTISPECIES: sugar porter family MFS transporter [unclassified Marinimicrobium]|jgi:sugar porter (SP) family MFS transporter|uniref:sugar porter family MFS transporter n=1 Tax=unclassified Marinimicrobium TaxID=2632100 RepID=UPI00257B6F7B|nr:MULTISPECIES: sugar porter family MFS transporter [unclassified Marinimicrobium]